MNYDTVTLVGVRLAMTCLLRSIAIMDDTEREYFRRELDEAISCLWEKRSHELIRQAREGLGELDQYAISRWMEEC